MIKGTRMMMKRSSAPLPYDAEVEWLDTNGAYIMTSATMKNVDDVTIYFTGTLLSWSEHQLIGNFMSKSQVDSSYTTDMRLIANDHATNYYFDTGYRRVLTTSARWAINSRIELEMHASQNAYVILNGTYQNIGNSFWGGYMSETDPIAICSCADGTGQRGRLKIERIAISQQGVFNIDLIPVRKGNDGFLYDKVSGALYGNSAFTIGSDKPTLLDFVRTNATQ